jgi:hypothetical protein
MSSAKSVTVNYTTPSAPALTINKVTIASGSTPVANLGTVTGGSFTTADTGTCTTLTGQVTKAACLATLPTAGVWTAASTSCGNTLATCGPVSEVLNGSYTLAATPASGHALKSLTDCTQNFTVVGGGTVTCVSYRQATVTMNASKTIQVNFDH